mmetsp:Transcript_6276/g.9282  ORF Transcript_6276/g.9282 Transcript_6276/m.9282 type:complete len:207 (-) Transcript_6276:391-1011(-)
MRRLNEAHHNQAQLPVEVIDLGHAFGAEGVLSLQSAVLEVGPLQRQGPPLAHTAHVGQGLLGNEHAPLRSLAAEDEVQVPIAKLHACHCGCVCRAQHLPATADADEVMRHCVHCHLVVPVLRHHSLLLLGSPICIFQECWHIKNIPGLVRGPGREEWAALGDDGGDELGRGHVEGRVPGGDGGRRNWHLAAAARAIVDLLVCDFCG